jgi:hypothetical protein
MHRRVEVCPIHKVGLLTISQKYPGYASEDFTSALMDNWREVVAAAESAAAIELTAYDRYFCDRLNGDPVGHEVLDELPYDSALRLCDSLGSMILGGEHKGRRKLSVVEIQAMAKAGFDLLSNGYAGLRAFLEKLDSQHHGADDKSVGSKLYGKLYDFLHDNADTPGFTSIVDFVRDHAFNVHPLGPENNFLGEGGVRKFHSVRSAFTAYGIHTSTLRKLLGAAGILDATDSAVRDLKVSVKVSVMDKIIEGWKDSVAMSFVRQRLDTAPQVVRQLVDAGMLDAATDKSDYSLNHYFSRQQIERLVARLAGC